MAKVSSFKGKKKGQNRSKKVVAANKLKKKAMKNKGVTKVKGDARNLLRDKKIKMVKKGGDARDILAGLAKNTDARKRLLKNRLMKRGIADAKTTKKGGITIITTTSGKLQLSTKRSKAKGAKKDPLVQVSQVGKNLTKSVNHASGQISLTTKPKPSALSARETTKKAKQQPQQQRRASTGAISRSRAMTPAARLDEELMNTHVDPIVIKRTVRQNIRDRERSRSPVGYRYRERSRSPPPMRSYSERYHYDDPRRELREEEMYRQRIREETRSSNLTSDMRYTSPLQGVKVVVSNLEESVTQEDINELFSDVGNVRNVRMAGKGVAEVVFARREHAEKAIDVYDKRQLDGRVMKLHIEGGHVQPRPYVSSVKMPSRREDRERDRDHREERSAPEVSAIHKALFSERKSSSSSLHFANSGTTQSQRGGSSKNPKFTVNLGKSNRRR